MYKANSLPNPTIRGVVKCLYTAVPMRDSMSDIGARAASTRGRADGEPQKREYLPSIE